MTYLHMKTNVLIFDIDAVTEQSERLSSPESHSFFQPLGLGLG